MATLIELPRGLKTLIKQQTHDFIEGMTRVELIYYLELFGYGDLVEKKTEQLRKELTMIVEFTILNMTMQFSKAN